jgi:hypothetical protein
MTMGRRKFGTTFKGPPLCFHHRDPQPLFLEIRPLLRWTTPIITSTDTHRSLFEWDWMCKSSLGLGAEIYDQRVHGLSSLRPELEFPFPNALLYLIARLYTQIIIHISIQEFPLDFYDQRLQASNQVEPKPKSSLGGASRSKSPTPGTSIFVDCSSSAAGTSLVTSGDCPANNRPFSLWVHAYWC